MPTARPLADGEMRTLDAEGVRAVLRQHGLRYSRPREIILRYLFERDRHVSAEGLFAALKRQGEDLSLSTVYLNLGVLASAGLVREFAGAGGEGLYDSNVHHHYHLICRETGEVRDVPIPLVEGKTLGAFLQDYVERLTGWQVEEPRVTLRGRAPRRGDRDAEPGSADEP